MLTVSLGCPGRAQKKPARNITPSSDSHWESDDDDDKIYTCHNCNEFLINSKTGTPGWAYYWLPHSFKDEHGEIRPLNIAISTKMEMCEETQELWCKRIKDETWKHFLWSPICCSCVISEFMNAKDCPTRETAEYEAVSTPLVMRTILDVCRQP